MDHKITIKADDDGAQVAVLSRQKPDGWFESMVTIRVERDHLREPYLSRAAALLTPPEDVPCLFRDWSRGGPLAAAALRALLGRSGRLE